jgi:hypothetical protein
LFSGEITLNNNSVVTTTGTTIPTDAYIKSGSIIEFDIAGASITEEIAGNSSKSYVAVADTTNIKNNASQGSTTSTQLRITGTRGSNAASNGFTWVYNKTSDGTSSGSLTLTNSYIVSGKPLLYQ